MSESTFAQELGQHQVHKRAFKVCIVAPVHIQPSENWINALNNAAKTATIIIVDDSDGKVVLPESWDVYDYRRQREAMGDELYAQFEQFHKSSSCKNFGTWLAYQKGFDPIIVIDSDCIIPPDFVAKHMEYLCMQGADRWTNPIEGTNWYSRGFPYSLRKSVKWAHMGLWENELDIYGLDRVDMLPDVPPKSLHGGGVKDAQFFPLSGMNVSFRRNAIPWMLFLPNFEYKRQKFTRHDDIWGGYIFQKVCELAKLGLSFGDPVVYHDTEVIPQEDADAEKAMVKYEADFYQFIDFVFASMLARYALNEHDVSSDWFFNELASLCVINGPFVNLIPAFKFWAQAFHDIGNK
jgi:hypothetical protein